MSIVYIYLIVMNITLKKYIEAVGNWYAAELFDCSIHSIKAWRYGHRQPSVDQAKLMIQKTNGILSYESIYGRVNRRA